MSLKFTFTSTQCWKPFKKRIKNKEVIAIWNLFFDNFVCSAIQSFLAGWEALGLNLPSHRISVEHFLVKNWLTHFSNCDRFAPLRSIEFSLFRKCKNHTFLWYSVIIVSSARAKTTLHLKTMSKWSISWFFSTFSSLHSSKTNWRTSKTFTPT